MRLKKIFKHGLSCLALIGGLMTINSINNNNKASAEEVGDHYTYNTGDWYWLKSNGNYMAQIWSNNNGGKYTITLHSGSFDDIRTYVFTDCFYFENIDDSGINTFGSSFSSGDSVFICESAPTTYGTSAKSDINLMIFGYQDGTYKIDIRSGTDPNMYSWGGAYGGAAVDYDKLISDSYTEEDLNAKYEEGFENGKNSVDITSDNEEYANEKVNELMIQFDMLMQSLENEWNATLEYINEKVGFITEEDIFNIWDMTQDGLIEEPSYKTEYYLNKLEARWNVWLEEVKATVDITSNDEQVIQDYITNNNYHTNTDYLNYGNQKYTEGQNSVDITTDNEAYAKQFIQNNNYHTNEEYLEYGETMRQKGIASVDTESDNAYYYEKGVEDGKAMIDITSNDKEIYDAGYNQCKEDKKFTTKLKNLWNKITDFFTETIPGLFSSNDTEETIKEDLTE